MDDEYAIKISNLSFKYPEKEEYTLSDINFSIKKGEKVALMGESGKGKSTLLRLIASYEKMQSGKIEINSKEIAEKMPNDIISYLPQDANKALFPWKNIKGNLYYPLSLRHDNLTEEDMWKKVKEMVYEFQLQNEVNDKKKYPLKLSGGEKKRLSLIMALSIQPKIVLLDEPFSALDFMTAENLWKYLRKYFKENETTLLLVTHSLSEAAVMADKVVFLDKDGKIVPLENESFQKYADQLTEDEKSKLEKPGELMLLPKFNEYKQKIRDGYEKNSTIHKE